jgi:DNA replication protein DnaD
MPQPSQGHCKNFQTLKLCLSKPKKTYMRPTIACSLELEIVQKTLKNCDKELITIKGQLNKVKHENQNLSNNMTEVEQATKKTENLQEKYAEFNQFN